MKIVALEEHLITQGLRDAWATAGFDQGAAMPWAPFDQMLGSVDARLADMDEDGVDVAVLSVPAPGVQDLTGADAVALARDANDQIAAMVATHPDRLQGFATLATGDPAAAATELRRCVNELGFPGAMINGRTGALNVDDPSQAEVWAAAAELGVPVYIHPMPPVAAVQDAYYRGVGDERFDVMFAGGFLGWHFETGLQLMRLILSGTFDRHPDLQVIVGHWGEMVLFYEERIGLVDNGGLGLERTLGEYLRQNVHYTGSGILSQRYLQWTLEVVGAERVMYATDYPFVTRGDGIMRRFLEDADIADADREKIAHGNWERLTGASS